MTDDPESVLRRDPVMADLIDRYELAPLEPVENEFERLVVSIVNQQLSTASAAAVRDRLFELLGGDVRTETVLDATGEELRDVGLSRTKAEYVQNAARAFEREDFTRDGLADHTTGEVVDALTEIKGVGVWTARMYCIFVLQHQDVLPLGDLAVRRGFEALYNDGVELSRNEMREIAEPWRPYRSRGTRYVWAAYEGDG